MGTNSYTLADGSIVTVSASSAGVPFNEGMGVLTQAIKAKIIASSGGGVSKLDATLELVNTTASGYSYSDITTYLASNTSDPRYLNSSTRVYDLEPREYYGGEVETFTFQYNGNANQAWLVPQYYDSVSTSRIYTGYSVIPSTFSNEYYGFVGNNDAATLELKRTAEDTYVLTLTAKGSYGGVENDKYLLIFPETDNYKGIIVYIHVSADE